MTVIGRVLRSLQVFHDLSMRRCMSFQSPLNLKLLYPSSTLTLTTPSSVPPNPDGKFNGYVPIDKLKISYTRSSGPGGQHVNTTNSKAEVRFELDKATWISEEVRQKLKDLHKNRITAEGYFIIKSEKTRSQQLNLADCLNRIRNIIWEAEEPVLKEPSPEEAAYKMKRLEKLNRERLKEKRMRSSVKFQRRTNFDFDS